MKRDTLQELATMVWERDSQPGEYLTDGFRLYRVVVSRVFQEERLVRARGLPNAGCLAGGRR